GGLDGEKGVGVVGHHETHRLSGLGGIDGSGAGSDGRSPCGGVSGGILVYRNIGTRREHGGLIAEVDVQLKVERGGESGGHGGFSDRDIDGAELVGQRRDGHGAAGGASAAEGESAQGNDAGLIGGGGSKRDGVGIAGRVVHCEGNDQRDILDHTVVNRGAGNRGRRAGRGGRECRGEQGGGRIETKEDTRVE